MLCTCSGFEGFIKGCPCPSLVHNQKGTGSRMGLRRATGPVDLAWLLGGVSPKPDTHLRDRDVEEATQGEGQQRCSPSQVEFGRSRPFHKPSWSLTLPRRLQQIKRAVSSAGVITTKPPRNFWISKSVWIYNQ